MTSDATTLQSIDAALVARYSGIAINTGTPSAVTSVSVFMEDPDPEMAPERKFPSIAMNMISIIPDPTLVESEDFNEEEISYDPGSTPPERTMRQRPLPYRVAYSLDTWHRARAGESRDLVWETVISRTQPRDHIILATLDGGTFDADLFWVGGMVNNDEDLVDEKIYHKTLTIEVVAYLTLVDVNDVNVEKVATTNAWSVYLQKYKLDKTGKNIEVTGQVKDVTFNITDTGVVPDP